MTNNSRTLNIWVINNLNRRVYEHKNKLIKGFTSKYNITKLVYFESTSDVKAAISREKQIKGWGRAKKEALISDDLVLLHELSKCKNETSHTTYQVRVSEDELWPERSRRLTKNYLNPDRDGRAGLRL